MKRVLAFIGLPLLVAIVLFLLLLRQGSDSTTLVLQEESLVAPAPAEDSSAADVSGAASSGADPSVDISGGNTYPTAPADVRLARVERLADGDSFDIRWLDTDESDEVRLLGINAPETTACFGDASRGVLQFLTDGRDLSIESIERDEFGRVIANVWSDDVLVNLRLVEVGAALALTDGSRYGQLIQDAQSAAQASSIGLWDPVFCGASDQAQLFIAEIFEDAPGQDNLNPNGEWIAIINEGDTPADLTGWSIRDESTRHRYFFPDGFILAGGADVRVYSGCGEDEDISLYWCDGDPVWNNTGDTAFLVDPDGKFADTVGYGE